MKKGKELKFNIYFNNNGENIETIIVESIINYLKQKNKGFEF